MMIDVDFLKSVKGRKADDTAFRVKKCIILYKYSWQNYRKRCMIKSRKVNAN